MFACHGRDAPCPEASDGSSQVVVCYSHVDQICHAPIATPVWQASLQLQPQACSKTDKLSHSLAGTYSQGPDPDAGPESACSGQMAQHWHSRSTVQHDAQLSQAEIGCCLAQPQKGELITMPSCRVSAGVAGNKGSQTCLDTNLIALQPEMLQVACR